MTILSSWLMSSFLSVGIAESAVKICNRIGQEVWEDGGGGGGGVDNHNTYLLWRAIKQKSFKDD